MVNSTGSVLHWDHVVRVQIHWQVLGVGRGGGPAQPPAGTLHHTSACSISRLWGTRSRGRRPRGTPGRTPRALRSSWGRPRACCLWLTGNVRGTESKCLIDLGTFWIKSTERRVCEKNKFREISSIISRESLIFPLFLRRIHRKSTFFGIYFNFPFRGLKDYFVRKTRK